MTAAISRGQARFAVALLFGVNFLNYIDRYVIAAELPGLARDQIELALEDSRLIIRGQRIDRTASSGDVIHFHQVERGHGAFSRTFEFGSKIDTEAVAADLTNGVLTITLPKAARAPARKIEVR